MKATTLRPQILPAGAEHLSAIAELAGVVWRACYPGIISHAQIEYMLARMYALEVLRDELRSQGIRYDRLLVDGQLAGFASCGPTGAPGVVKLHKLYLRAEFHGRGLGSRLLQHVEREARRSGARRLVLSVNRRNVKGIAAYRRNGFVIAESVVTDIGGGFVMDDYIMAKELSEVRSKTAREDLPSLRPPLPPSHKSYGGQAAAMARQAEAPAFAQRLRRGRPARLALAPPT